MSNRKHIRRKRKLHKGRVLGCLVISLVLCMGILYGVESYNFPEIYGTWISEQTGEQVVFKKNGEVILDDVKEKAKFERISSNRMNYTTIEGINFEMYYDIEDRVLYWGLDADNVEIFNRK